MFATKTRIHPELATSELGIAAPVEELQMLAELCSLGHALGWLKPWAFTVAILVSGLLMIGRARAAFAAGNTWERRADDLVHAIEGTFGRASVCVVTWSPG